MLVRHICGNNVIRKASQADVGAYRGLVRVLSSPSKLDTEETLRDNSKNGRGFLLSRSSTCPHLKLWLEGRPRQVLDEENARSPQLLDTPSLLALALLTLNSAQLCI